MSYLEQVGGENSPLVSPGYDEFARGSALLRLQVPDTTSPSGSTAMDFLAKMQANWTEEKELAANTTQVAYSPTDIKSALVKDAETNALMAAMHTTVTTPSTVHFAFSAWPPAAAQLSRLLPNLNLTSPLTLETSLTPFSASSLRTSRLTSSHCFIMWASDEPVPLHDMCVISGVPSGIGLKTLATLVALGYTPATADTWMSRRDVADAPTDAAASE
ncbi:hypothetical protein BCR44DRAFT_1508502 [Catenaria anguillulae PL171]|uniref:Uncharacterized protein n=1 Tax=Catenaria anguillulae PL171 TaxID=765915 RepID=A0A1Y2GL98_9FUNG|nr:hypothetical protein BCR44DRAFT_1508502 [Catenaria anguillulae PL171]